MSKKLVSTLFCVVLTLALLVTAFVLPTAAAAPEAMKEFDMVGEWIWGETVANAGEDGAEKIVGRCAEMGITDIYLLVKGTGGKITWLNTEFTEKLTRTDRDVLQEVIDAAAPYGIRVHAWIVTVEDEAYKTANPDSGMWHYVRGRDNNRITPYDEGYVAYMKKIAAELAAYDIDGLHFDYIRYNHACNGWSEVDFANLEAMGANIDRVKELIEKTFYAEDADSNYIFNAYNNGDPDALLIAQYRRNNVNNLAKAIIDAAKAVKPDLIISAALMPEGAYDAAFGDIHYGQNYTDAAELYDYVCPMAYTNSYGQSSPWMAKVAKGSIDKGNKVVMGLQSFYPLTSAQLMSDIEAVRDLLNDANYADNTLGIVHFRNSQFSYAKVTYDNNNKVMTIKVINPSDTYDYAWTMVELQEGLKAVSGEVVDGFKADATVEVGESYVKFSGDAVLPMDTAGTLTVKYEGDLDVSKAPALVRIYMTNESRAYNIYENVTVYPEIVKNPETKTVYQGEEISFTVEATGEGELSYQWYKSPDLSYGTMWEKIEGATEATYTIPAAVLDDDGVKFRCVVTDAFGNEVVSKNAKAHVLVGSDYSNKFEIVGEWVWGSTVADMGEDGAKILTEYWVENGITDVYLLVKGTGGGLSWLNTAYPENLSRTDRDVLQEAIDAAHPYGIRVHAWVVTVEDAAYKAANPDAGMWHYVRAQDNNRINPYDEGYRAYMTDLMAELAAYDIDGIHFDYIRYNHLANGWSETDFANLEAMGANVERVRELIDKTLYTADKDAEYIFDAYNEGDPDALLIAQYRRDNIVDFAEALINAAKAVNPDLIFSAATMPEGAYDLAFANLHYGQSYEDAADLYDYICPMVYTGDYGQCSTWIARAAKNAIKMGNQVVMGLQSYYPTKSVGLAADIEAARHILDTEYASGMLGIVHFRTTQFSYSTTYYVENVQNSGQSIMLVHLTNPSNTYKFQWAQIEMQEGLKIVDAQVLPEVFGVELEGVLLEEKWNEIQNNISQNTTIEIAEDGSYVKFSGTDMIGTLSDGWVAILFEGEIDPTKAPSVTRILNSNETRAYCTFVDMYDLDQTPEEKPDEDESAKTADSSAVLTFAAMMMVSMTGMVVLTVKKRRTV